MADQWLPTSEPEGVSLGMNTCDHPGKLKPGQAQIVRNCFPGKTAVPRNGMVDVYTDIVQLSQGTNHSYIQPKGLYYRDSVSGDEFFLVFTRSVGTASTNWMIEAWKISDTGSSRTRAAVMNFVLPAGTGDHDYWYADMKQLYNEVYVVFDTAMTTNRTNTYCTKNVILTYTSGTWTVRDMMVNISPESTAIVGPSPELPCYWPTRSAPVVTLGSYMYMVGGGAPGTGGQPAASYPKPNSNGATAEVWRSADGINWYCITRSGAFGARMFHSLCVFNSTMYVAGGIGTSGTVLSTMYSSTDGVTWTAAHALPKAMYNHQMLSFTPASTETLWLIGGRDASNVGLAEVYSATNPSSGGSWSTVTTTAEFGRLSEHSAVSFNGAMWVIGGLRGELPGRLVGTVWQSTTGATWTARSPKVAGAGRALASNGALMVCVGDDGAIYTTPSVTTNDDGTTTTGLIVEDWQLQTSPTSNTLYGIIWTGEMFVAVGAAGTIITSPDGITWVTRTTGTFALLRSVACTAALTVVVGDGGAVLSSPDNVTWTVQSNGSFFGMVYNTGLSAWFAVGENGQIWTTATPETAATWAPVSSPAGMTKTLRAICRGASNSMVAVGDGGTIISSSNGTYWVNCTSPVTEDLLGVAYTGGVYVAVGSGNVILKSTDAATWYAYRLSGVRSIAAGGGVYVAVGDGAMIMRSTDGLQWTRASTMPTYAVQYDNATFRSVRYMNVPWHLGYGGGNAWIFVAVTGAYISFSTDGDTWTDRTPNCIATSPPGSYFQDMACSGNSVVMVGTGGNIMYSTDMYPLHPWAMATSPTTENLYSVTWNGTRYVAVGAGGVTCWNNVGTTWTLGGAAGTADLYAVASSASHAIAAVGAGGVVYQSTDNGTSWGRQASATTHALRSITWAGSRFLAVGDGGILVTSTTGVGWSSVSTGVTGNLYAICADTAYFAGGLHGLMLVSSDGAVWAPQAPVPMQTYRAVTFDISNFVVVGDKGDGAYAAIATSPVASGGAWTDRSSGVACDLYAVGGAAGAPGIIACGSGGNILSDGGTSGIGWTGQVVGTAALLGVSTANGVEFVICGVGGTVLTSPNAAAWSVQSSGTTADLYAIYKYSTTRIVAGGKLGTMITSTVGATWAVLAAINSLNAVCVFMPLGWVAVGNNGRVCSSADGLSWLGFTSVTSSALYAVMHNPSWGFTAVGASGAQVYSGFGFAAWILLGTLGAGTYRSMAAGSAGTVLVGDTGSILRQSGNTFVACTSPTAENLHAVAWDGIRYVAVADHGVVVYSTNAVDWYFASLGSFAGVPAAKGMAAVVFGSTLVLSGGYGSTDDGSGRGDRDATNGMLATLDCVTWEAHTDGIAWLPRARHAMAVFGSSLYIIGGQGDANSSTYVYPSYSDVWKAINLDMWINTRGGIDTAGWLLYSATYVRRTDAYVVQGASRAAYAFPSWVLSGSDIMPPVDELLLGGIVSLAASGTALSGAGTNFQGQLVTGDYIRIDGYNYAFLVKTIDPSTQNATVNTNSCPVTFSGCAYTRLPRFAEHISTTSYNPGIDEGIENLDARQAFYYDPSSGNLWTKLVQTAGAQHPTGHGATHLRIWRSELSSTEAVAKGATLRYLMDIAIDNLATDQASKYIYDTTDNNTMIGETNTCEVTGMIQAPATRFLMWDTQGARLWAGGNPDNPGYWFYSAQPSNVAYPQKYASWFNPLQYMSVSPNDGQRDTGIVQLAGDIYFFKENSLYILDNGNVDGAPRCISPTIGCAFPNSIAMLDVEKLGGQCVGFLSTRGPMILRPGARLQTFYEYAVKEIWPRLAGALTGGEILLDTQSATTSWRTRNKVESCYYDGCWYVFFGWDERDTDDCSDTYGGGPKFFGFCFGRDESSFGPFQFDFAPHHEGTYGDTYIHRPLLMFLRNAQEAYTLSHGVDASSSPRYRMTRFGHPQYWTDFMVIHA